MTSVADAVVVQQSAQYLLNLQHGDAVAVPAGLFPVTSTSIRSVMGAEVRGRKGVAGRGPGSRRRSRQR